MRDNKVRSFYCNYYHDIIFYHLCSGKSNKEIAERLNLNLNSLNYHIKKHHMKEIIEMNLNKKNLTY